MEPTSPVDKYSCCQRRWLTRSTRARIQRQMTRSKTKVEGHLCYPWLRRIFFNLSHYFPNLHTNRSTSTNRRRAGRQDSCYQSSTSGFCERPQRQELPQRQQPYRLYDRSFQDNYNENSETQNMDIPEKLTNNKISPQRGVQNEVEEGTSSSEEAIVLNIAADSPIEQNERLQKKRRPLRRQKVSGVSELENENTARQTSRYLVDPMKCKHQCSPNEHSHEATSQQPSGLDQMSPSTNWFDAKTTTGSTIPQQAEAGGQAISPSSRRQKISVHQCAAENVDTDDERDEFVEYCSRGGVIDFASFQHIDEDRQVCPLRLRDPSTVAHMSESPRETQSLAITRIPSRDSCNKIEYQRAKARRNSSVSQTDLEVIEKHRIVAGHHSSQCLYNKMDPSRTTNMNFNNFESEMLNGRRPSAVNRQVESWLDESNRLKESRKKAIFLHLNSGDVANERVICSDHPQPHSFDCHRVDRTEDSPTHERRYQASISRKDRLQAAYAGSGYEEQSQLITEARPDWMQFDRLKVPTSSASVGTAAGTSSSCKSPDCAVVIVPSLTVDSQDDCSSPFFNSSCGLLSNTTCSSDSKHHLNNQAVDNNHCKDVKHHRRLKFESLSFASGLKPDLSVKEVQSEQLLPPTLPRERASSFQETTRQKTWIIQSQDQENQERITNRSSLRRNSYLKMAAVKQSKSFTENHVLFPQLLDPQKPQNQHLRSFGNSYLHTRPRSSHSNDSTGFRHSRTQHRAQRNDYCWHPTKEKYFVNTVNRLQPWLMQHQSPNSSSVHLPRRYSHHLKPNDAWQSQQSHSIEGVNAGKNSLTMIFPDQSHPIRPFLRYPSPILHSHSVQQSISFCPLQWNTGFYSGPEMSSPFDPTCLTPDSLKVKHFFQGSLDSPEQKRLLPRQPRLTKFVSNSSSLRSSLTCENDTTPSSSFGEGQAFAMVMPAVNKVSSLTTMPNNLFFTSANQNGGSTTERKTKSFELDSRNRLKSRIGSHLVPYAHISTESQPGSSFWQTKSMLFAEARQEVLDREVARGQMPLTKSEQDAPMSFPESPMPTSPPFSSQQSKLVPPNLTFSPASRRTSLVDPTEEGTTANFDRNESYYTNFPHHKMLSDDYPVTVEKTPLDTALNQVSPNQGRFDVGNVAVHLYGTDSNDNETNHPQNKNCSISEESMRHSRQMHTNLANISCNTDKPGLTGSLVLGYATSKSQPQLYPLSLRVMEEQDNMPNVYIPLNNITHEKRHLSSDCRSPQKMSYILSHNYDTPYHLFRRTSRHVLTKTTAPQLELASKRCHHQYKDELPNFVPTEYTNRCKPESLWHRYPLQIRRQTSGLIEHDSRAQTPLNNPTSLTTSSDYLFRSSSSSHGESTVDPKLLIPSLRPVTDSSDENASDPTEDELEARASTGDASREVKESAAVPCITMSSTLAHEQLAARRRSFLAQSKQKALHRSDDTSIFQP